MYFQLRTNVGVVLVETICKWMLESDLYFSKIRKKIIKLRRRRKEEKIERERERERERIKKKKDERQEFINNPR